MSDSQLKCLIELLRLSERNQYVASISVAKRLNISKPSAHRLLDGLKRMGYIEKLHYGAASLTETGKQTAVEMQKKAQELSGLLADTVVKEDRAYNAALMLLANLDHKSFLCFDSDAETGDAQ
ncbi:MAG: helix-turn-helix domain-containing protein [Clostridiales bacterium]|nr:helix-turn-helix domain-containing protein [Clostridiales bacterium]